MSSKHRYIVTLLYIGVLWPGFFNSAVGDDMVLIDKGAYTPLFKSEDGPQRIAVDAFYLDIYPVTNAQFAAFVEKNPKWSRERIKPVFSDDNYLKQFTSENLPAIANQPVTNVSWFAARAYCKTLNKRLPTIDEWEYAAKASLTQADGSNEPEYKQRILDWYGRPSSAQLPDVQNTPKNYWQVHAMHGVVWELVSDFNTALVTGESRGDSQLEKALFCGAGSSNSVDPGDYAAFMRYAMRSSYEAHYTIESLGFRCARGVK